jgi:hypothetical protein
MVSENGLTIAIAANELFPDKYDVCVLNRPPGGGVSDAARLTVT